MSEGRACLFDLDSQYEFSMRLAAQVSQQTDTSHVELKSFITALEWVGVNTGLTRNLILGPTSFPSKGPAKRVLTHR